MDENAFRQVLSASISRPCPFGKSVLTRCVSCSLAEKHNVAEREVVACSDEASMGLCIELHGTLRQNFTFALHRRDNGEPLTHSQEMRVQCGGLKGLQYALDESGEVRDVSALVALAQQKFGELANFPYSLIVQRANVAYKGR
jgi:hypothetical protein